MSKVTVVGTGYVGLVQGVCLAELGNTVTCVDIDSKKVDKLRKGISPIYEPGIEEFIERNLAAGRIRFETSLKDAMSESEIIFIAVGTPPGADGKADLQYVVSVAEEIGQNLKNYQVIVNKSTVPIGTGEMVKSTIAKFYKGDFDVVSNPEFLKEGSAIEDFMHPDRVVIGSNNGKRAVERISKLYEVLDCPILVTDLEAAEMIKYASNSFLAVEISFINSLANLCEKVGANVTEVAKGMRLDKRIGSKAFLDAGIGYGGSCFPKDVDALIEIGQDNDEPLEILEQTRIVNKKQRERFSGRIIRELGGVSGKKIALWGLAFKPKTDDIRFAPSLTIISHLLEAGATLSVYDPVASDNVKQVVKDPKVTFANSSAAACEGADALVIVTEWDEFYQTDFSSLAGKLKNKTIFDGRNILDPQEMKDLGYAYHCIGKRQL